MVFNDNLIVSNRSISGGVHYWIMNDRIEIPNSLIGVVADVLGSYYYSHSRLNTIFMGSGAPGDPPEGNCVNKCVSWLRRCNKDYTINPIEILGTIIQDFMDSEFGESIERWPP